MKLMIKDDVNALFAAANSGPFMEASLIALDDRGALRVTYNWLYSALNCDPQDGSTFPWVFYKVDASHVALMPKEGYGGQRLYASVRDDLNWNVQVQAPFSADWITGIGRDEILSFEISDLMLGWFKGFNGGYLSVNPNQDAHGGHAGYCVRSAGAAQDTSSLLLIQVHASLQPQLQFQHTGAVSAQTLAQGLLRRGLALPANFAGKVDACLALYSVS